MFVLANPTDHRSNYLDQITDHQCQIQILRRPIWHSKIFCKVNPCFNIFNIDTH
jgi:hypothetical protein